MILQLEHIKSLAASVRHTPAYHLTQDAPPDVERFLREITPAVVYELVMEVQRLRAVEENMQNIALLSAAVLATGKSPDREPA